MAELQLQRKQLVRMLADLPSDAVEAVGDAPNAAEVAKLTDHPSSAQNESRRQPASAFILETLQKEEGRGIPGPRLQALAKDAGYTKDAFDKARTRLRDSRRIEMVDGLWAIASPRQLGVQTAA
jgi:hypothetical protein